MVKNILIQLQKKLKEYGVIISFTGAFSQGIIEEVGDALKVYLNEKKNTKGKVYKVFSVFIEQTQNVKNYVKKIESEKIKDKILTSGVIIIGETDEKYFISSGNLIREEDIGELKKLLEKIRNLSKKEINKLYRKRLRTEMRTEEGGAGMGLIEMARKSSQKIDYQFIEKEDGYKYFTLTVYV